MLRGRPMSTRSISFSTSNCFNRVQKIRERLGRNVFQRLRDGFGFVADGDADAFGSVVEGEDAH